MNTGMLYAAAAYAVWGLLPVYWKSLQSVPAYEVLCHRMTWSLVFVMAIHGIRRDWSWIRHLRERPKIAVTYFVTASVLAINWWTYIWSVNSGQIVETSLGYFINPLIYILLGVILLSEKLRKAQWFAIGIAGLGMLYLTVQYGKVPWIAFVLAGTFSVYGLLRKTGPLDSLDGLTLETTLLFIPALGVLFFLEVIGTGSMTRGSLQQGVLLSGSGVATGLPLLFFAAGARRIRLVTLGILHYIAPTLQFLIGIFAYHEPFEKNRAIGFVFVWAALAVYTVEGLHHNRTKLSVSQKISRS